MNCHSISVPSIFQILVLVSVCLSGNMAPLFSQAPEEDSIDLSSPDQIMLKQDMKDILSRTEFRHLTRERDITKDAPFEFDELFNQETETELREPSNPAFSALLGNVMQFLAYVSVVVTCGLILYLLIRSLMGLERKKKATPTEANPDLQGSLTLEEIISPAERESSIYLQRAKVLAQEGDYHNAIIQLLYGSMSYIERSGWIRFRKGLTYRDYIRAARPHGLPCDSLRQMIRTYEPLGFGRRKATREHFESTLKHYESAFQKQA
ncbi:DUF4129 domain-containing protein [Gimesia algae]|uniref:Protein-glutamine gamma-glutamyltransferase-like C-terminal domain-containing protein n=1 Tax=Gimesia algae TaxID=2527971 RepID=A0A517VLI8_9PLAN|nr:DUF4129 domain-containing protein [Gimesia algae]QDT93889.1 hypothetical protein Pan161_55760 [Gimesia algae]